jgi:MFS family permease
MASKRSLVLAIGVTQTLAWASTYYVPATMLGAAAAEFGVSRTVLLGGFSLAMLVCGLCSPAVGRTIDRVGGRGVLAASAVVTAAGLLGLAAAPSMPVWYLAWSVVGVGMAMGLYDAAFATIGRLLGAQARPAIVGVTLMAGFSSSLGWPAGTWLVAHIGWRAAMVSYAVMQLTVILPISWYLVPRAAAAIVTVSDTPDLPAPRAGSFALMATYFTLRSAITAVISVHALVLLAGLGASTEQAVLAATLIGPAQVGSRVLDWRFGRGFTPMVAAVTGTVMLPAAFLSLVLGGPFALFGVLYGMSNGILTITRGTLPLHVFGPAGFGRRLGRIALPSMIVSALAPTLLSPLIDVWPAVDVVLVVGGVGVVSLGCLLALQRR